MRRDGATDALVSRFGGPNAAPNASRGPAEASGASGGPAKEAPAASGGPAKEAPAARSGDKLQAALEEARGGREYHQMVEQNQQKGQYGDWSLERQNEKIGGQGKPDEVWVNHNDKKVVIVDIYTGGKQDVQTPSGPESARHNEKGWNYIKEPYIQELIRQGFSVDYQVGSRPLFLDPKHLH